MSSEHSDPVSKISVVKEIRNGTGLSLKSSADLLNKLMEKSATPQSIHQQITRLIHLCKVFPRDPCFVQKVVSHFLWTGEGVRRSPEDRNKLRCTEGLSARKMKELLTAGKSSPRFH